MQNQNQAPGHAEMSVLSALISSYPRPLSVLRLISDGLPGFGLAKNECHIALILLQEKRLVRYRHYHLSLTRHGEQAIRDVISATHSIQ